MRRVRIFDFAAFSKPLTEAIRNNAEAVAQAAGLEIDYIRKSNFRKEDKIKKVLAERGEHPGLVFNGHNWLARELAKENIEVRMLDNAMAHTGDWARAQELADQLDPAKLHGKLDELAKRYVPILEQIQQHYHWSLEAVECVFR